MRKNQLLSVLSLFLLVPASITRAQITKTLNGTVRYESGRSISTLKTPNGAVVVEMPLGSVISGTVSTEPAGKTEKEKNRNLKELLKLVVMLDGQKIPVSATPTTFDRVTTSAGPGRTPLELLNLSGTKVAEVSLPPALSPSAIINPGNAPVLSTPSKLLVKGDKLNVYTDQRFTPGEKFVVTDAKGQKFTIKPVCLSSEQAILSIPNAAVSGPLSVRQEALNTPAATTIQTENGWLTCTLVDISLNSPNTNLRPGQKSEVLADVVWISPDIEDLLNLPLPNFNIDLKNLNPNIVTMEGGNLQRVNVSTIIIEGDNGEMQPRRRTIKRNITGNAVGSFSVSATLHEDYSTSNDPFRPQLNILQTPEDFNAWANALKKDLGQYATVRSRIWTFGDDGTPYRFNQNIQRAIGNMPVCTSPEQLDESKAVAYSLLHPLNVPKGAANTWSSSYEAFKSALKPLNQSPADRTMLPDREVISNGLDFMERAAHRNNDKTLGNSIADARQAVDKFDENANTNNTEFYSQLKSISDRAGSLVQNKNDTWKLADLLFSTYCFDKKTRDGIDPMKSMVGYLDPVHKILRATPEYQQKILASLHAVPAGNGNYHITAVSQSMTPVYYDIHLMPFERTNTFDSEWWAEHLIETILKKDTSRGNIITTTKDSTGTYFVFYKDAKCEVDKGSEKEESSGCMEETEWDAQEQKSKPTGRHMIITCYKNGTCKKGTDFCTEAYIVSCIRQIYMDANCTKRLKTYDFKHFSCL